MQIKAVVSGGAPLAPHVEDFLRVTMCAPVVQVGAGGRGCGGGAVVGEVGAPLGPHVSDFLRGPGGGAGGRGGGGGGGLGEGEVVGDGGSSD